MTVNGIESPFSIGQKVRTTYSAFGTPARDGVVREIKLNSYGNPVVILSDGGMFSFDELKPRR